ncbi:hypothetical protein RJT34_16726 [Clitoria ternatea]|uniref:Uncharacterized protein n=1 Tax=Clitoria ternatea TaxID=43366 RepID=A0AAN9J8V1_CLITE
MTMILMVICSIGSGLSFGHTPKSVMATLCFFRFWLGFGIGGDYPLSTTIMSEYSNKKTHGIGFEILAAGIFVIIILGAFKARFDAPLYEVDAVEIQAEPRKEEPKNKDKTKADVGYPEGIGVKNALIVLGVVNMAFSLHSWCMRQRENLWRRCHVRMKRKPDPEKS